MDYYSGTPDPNDEYNEDVNYEGSFESRFPNFNAKLVLIVLAVIIVILIVIFFLTGSKKTFNYNTKDRNSLLGTLSVYGGTLSPEFSSDVIKYTVKADSDYVTFSCAASSKKAKVENCDDSIEVKNEEVIHEIKVTAEDGTVTRYRFVIIPGGGQEGLQ